VIESFWERLKLETGNWKLENGNSKLGSDSAYREVDENWHPSHGGKKNHEHIGNVVWNQRNTPTIGRFLAKTRFSMNEAGMSFRISKNFGTEK